MMLVGHSQHRQHGGQDAAAPQSCTHKVATPQHDDRPAGPALAQRAQRRQALLRRGLRPWCAVAVRGNEGPPACIAPAVCRAACPRNA